jgi:hypothetical protein
MKDALLKMKDVILEEVILKSRNIDDDSTLFINLQKQTSNH